MNAGESEFVSNGARMISQDLPHPTRPPETTNSAHCCWNDAATSRPAASREIGIRMRLMRQHHDSLIDGERHGSCPSR